MRDEMPASSEAAASRGNVPGRHPTRRLGVISSSIGGTMTP